VAPQQDDGAGPGEMPGKAGHLPLELAVKLPGDHVVPVFAGGDHFGVPAIVAAGDVVNTRQPGEETVLQPGGGRLGQSRVEGDGGLVLIVGHPWPHHADGSLVY
jgi:hypothetical protein